MFRFKRFLTDDRGATSIEYALILSLVFLAIVASVTNYSTRLGMVYNNVANNLR